VLAKLDISSNEVLKNKSVVADLNISASAFVCAFQVNAFLMAFFLLPLPETPEKGGGTGQGGGGSNKNQIGAWGALWLPKSACLFLNSLVEKT
jgi:hypothetical protein